MLYMVHDLFLFEKKKLVYDFFLHFAFLVTHCMIQFALIYLYIFSSVDNFINYLHTISTTKIIMEKCYYVISCYFGKN